MGDANSTEIKVFELEWQKTPWFCISAALTLGRLQVVGQTRNRPFGDPSCELLERVKPQLLIPAEVL